MLLRRNREIQMLLFITLGLAANYLAWVFVPRSTFIYHYLDVYKRQAFDAICIKRGFVLKGGRPDRLRGAQTIINELRSGRIGRVTLEQPQNTEEHLD